MDKLKQLIEREYNYAVRSNKAGIKENIRIFESHAYGAATLYIILHPEAENYVVRLWELWHEKFIDLYTS